VWGGNRRKGFRPIRSPGASSRRIGAVYRNLPYRRFAVSRAEAT